MALLFNDRHASSVLNQAELQAVEDYLELEVPAFGPKVMQISSLKKLLG